MEDHRLRQEELIKKIATQIAENSFVATTVKPIEDFAKDARNCLTSVHFPNEKLAEKLKKEIIEPLQKIEPDFYYLSDSLHLTLKNVRTIDHTSPFSIEDIQKAKKVFGEVIPQHKKYKVYFYRFLLFQNSLTLVGTTDEELDNIIFDLNKKLTAVDLADDKVYANSKYFFASMTLARFGKEPSGEFKKKINELSTTIKFEPYVVDSINLVTGNAVLKRREIIDTWQLK